jgi:acyl dehydratase
MGKMGGLVSQGSEPVRSQRVLDAEWLDELCLWLQRPRGDVGSIGWPMVLIPELALPEDSLQVFHRVSWRAPVPIGVVELVSEPHWVSGTGSRTEIGLGTRALVGDQVVAESLMVARTRTALPDRGERALPSRPHLTDSRHARSLVVDRSQVQTFARLAGTSYPIHDDATYARGAGYPDVLLQGLLLLLIELHHADPGPAGRIEMWFRQPVPAGSLLDVHVAGENPAIAEYRLVGKDQVAATAAVFAQPL